MATKLTAISTTTEARAELRAFQAVATGAAGHVLNMSEALILAVRIATTHLSEVPAIWADMSNAESSGETQ